MKEPVCVHSKTVMGCPGCTARNKRFAVRAIRERDQLRKQVEKLLARTDAVFALPAPPAGSLFHLPDTPEARARLRRLKQAADQVRKELEG